MTYSELETRTESTQATSQTPLEKVVATLQGLLPAGTAVAVAWRDDVLGEGSCVLPVDATVALQRARRALADAPAGDDGPAQRCFAWEHASGVRLAAVIDAAGALAPHQCQAWQGTARVLIGCAIDSMRQHVEIKQLQRARQLQRALFEIADLAGADLAMSEMLGYFHRILCSLMYAENCYIVECDERQESLKFLFYVDTQDDFVPEAGRSYHHDEMPGSLTFAVLRHGRVMSGPSRELHRFLEYPPDTSEGAESLDWLGVPMWRDNRVCGAIVVQSYVGEDSYGEEERALLDFVAKQILTTMDRHQTHMQLEERVQQRTQELERINVHLQEEIVERRRAEQLQAALFNISELAMGGLCQDAFLAQVHAIISGLLDASNFYVAMVSASGDGIEFVYSVDRFNREGRRCWPCVRISMRCSPPVR
jgi:GAF domain-containing protein